MDVSALLATLSTPDAAALVWGVFPRALGLAFFISLAAFAYQLPSGYGQHGLTPLSSALAARFRAFGARALWFFPTLFWVTGASDAALVAVPALGALCGACAIVGGAWSPWFLGGAWAALLSIDGGPSGCVYPWDSLLLEGGFLALFLPATHSLAPVVSAALRGGALLPALAAALPAVAPPAPLLSFAFRWLLFRVLVGFGKLKFGGAGWRDRLYIKNFIVNQPMITPLGWWAYHALPDAVWVGALAGMFVVELVLPFGLFVPGLTRLVAGANIAGLMVGIQATGNYGYFNVLTAIMCIPAAAVADGLSFSSRDAASAPVFAAIFLAYILPLSVIQLIMNSWINMAWHHWSGIERLRLPLVLQWSKGVAWLLREAGHLRLVSAYGVFPPSTSPAQRWAVVFEGSADGRAWARYEYAFYLSSPRTPPRFVAPYHPRADHAVFYESLGANATMLSVLGTNSPYPFPTSAAPWVAMQVRLLQGGAAVRTLGPVFSRNPFPDPAAPPRFVRALTCHYTPTTPAHARATGEYWTERPAALHCATLSLEQLARDAHLPPLEGEQPRGCAPEQQWPFCDAIALPEDFWCEHTTWRARAQWSAGGVTPAAYEEAWGFLAAMRAAAAEAAAAGGDGAGSGGEAPLQQRARSGSRSADSDAASAAADTSGEPRPRSRGRAGATGGAGAVPSGPPVTSTVTPPATQPGGLSAPVGHLSVARHKLLPLDAAARAAGASAVSRTAIDAPLPPSAAAETLVWRALPRVVSALRSRYSRAQLARVRTTLARLVAPLLRAAERVLQRPAPTRDELLREAQGAGKVGAAADAYAREVLEALSGDWPDGRGVDGVYAFRGNDDAGAPGAMRNPLRWLMHSHTLLLTGGRRAYERVAADLLGEPRGVVGALRVRLAPGGSDALGAAPLPALWDALTSRGAARPERAGTEEGSFLLWALEFDALTTLASTFHRMNAQSRPQHRPGEPLPQRSPAFLPAVLELVPRITAHAGLRPRHGVEGAVPRWKLTADESQWVFDGLDAGDSL